jgi:hypothetical protein
MTRLLDDARKTGQGLYRFRQMLVDLTDAVQKEIAVRRRITSCRNQISSIRTDAGLQSPKRSRRARTVPEMMRTLA